jgi:hypothetical protein
MSRGQREELARVCFASRVQFYRECLAMAVEHFLCEARTRDPGRKPEEADAIDLQHGVLALSYCDAFVTEDRYASATLVTQSRGSHRCHSPRCMAGSKRPPLLSGPRPAGTPMPDRSPAASRLENHGSPGPFPAVCRTRGGRSRHLFQDLA